MKISNFFSKALYIGLVFTAFSCGDDDGGDGNPGGGGGEGKIPTIETIDVTEIGKTTAMSGGMITDDGGSDITARGICWSTLPEPNINNNKSEDGAGLGNFTSAAIDLDGDTKYYLRAYATNASGTGYGNEIEFSTVDYVIIDVNGTTFWLHKDAVFDNQWGPMEVETKATGSSGKQNTDIITGFTGDYAAKKCAELELLGYNDWFLPSSSQLESMFEVEENIVPSTAELFWSSTEDGPQSAFTYSIEEGGPFGTDHVYENAKYAVYACPCTRIAE